MDSLEEGGTDAHQAEPWREPSATAWVGRGMVAKLHVRKSQGLENSSTRGLLIPTPTTFLGPALSPRPCRAVAPKEVLCPPPRLPPCTVAHLSVDEISHIYRACTMCKITYMDSFFKAHTSRRQIPSLPHFTDDEMEEPPSSGHAQDRTSQPRLELHS